MSKARALCFTALFGVVSQLLLLARQNSGQAKAEPKADTPLQVELESTENTEGMPSRFLFRLVNRTNHDVQLPDPMMRCDGGIDGKITLQVSFRPLYSGDKMLGSGCAIDSFDRPLSILVRLKNWKFLHAGEAMTFEVPSNVFFSDQKPGTYEIWATYTPPAINREDQKFLRDAGIDSPQSELVSAHLTFEKKP